VTDTSGLLVGVVVHPADIQDRDGAGIVIQAIHDLFPWLCHLFADSVYNGPNLRDALAKFGDWTIEIVTRAAGVKPLSVIRLTTILIPSNDFAGQSLISVNSVGDILLSDAILRRDLSHRLTIVIFANRLNDNLIWTAFDGFAGCHLVTIYSTSNG